MSRCLLKCHQDYFMHGELNKLYIIIVYRKLEQIVTVITDIIKKICHAVIALKFNSAIWGSMIYKLRTTNSYHPFGFGKESLLS